MRLLLENDKVSWKVGRWGRCCEINDMRTEILSWYGTPYVDIQRLLSPLLMFPYPMLIGKVKVTIGLLCLERIDLEIAGWGWSSV